MKKTQNLNIGELYCLKYNGASIIGTLYWSDKKKFRFMLEFRNAFMYYHRIYFNNSRHLSKLEVKKYECSKSDSGFVRKRLTVSLASRER